jgi:gamma-glutamylcyclotransferase (GGCT)/AIG2-like uncharacterized protein YtfP
MTDYLFVYGTLARSVNHPMHRHLVRHAEYAGEGTFNGILYRVAHYPGAVASSDPNDVVHGELYRLRDSDALFAALDAVRLVIVEIVGDFLLVEEGARLLHGVAVLDAVDRDRHFCFLAGALFAANGGSGLK